MVTRSGFADNSHGDKEMKGVKIGVHKPSIGVGHTTVDAYTIYLLRGAPNTRQQSFTGLLFQAQRTNFVGKQTTLTTRLGSFRPVSSCLGLKWRHEP